MSNTGTPFVVRSDLSTISVAYKNQRLIADEVFPRVGVKSRAFEYTVDNYGDNFTIPDSRVGRLSRTADVSASSTNVTASVQDYALQRPVPQYDLDTIESDFNLLGKATEQVTDLLLLDREVRAASLTFNANNYASGYKTTLSSTSQWSHADSDPLKAILDALDSCVMRPNVMVIGRGAYSALIRNQKVVAAMHGNNGVYGIANKQFLLDTFSLEDILVGEAYVNTNGKGNTVSLSRCWGKHCALIFRNLLADTNYGTTFGFTGQLGNRETMLYQDYNKGMKGSTIVRVGESVKEIITANNLGYLFTDASA